MVVEMVRRAGNEGRTSHLDISVGMRAGIAIKEGIGGGKVM